MNIKRLSLLGAMLLAGCGGGSGDSSFGTGTSGSGSNSGGSTSGDAFTQRTAKSDPLANFCAEPRSGTDPYSGQKYPDKSGTIDNEKNWLNTFMHEIYLWDTEIPNVSPTTYTKANYNNSVQDAMSAYFDALLTPQKTASGKLKDQFSFTYNTAAYDNLSQGGIEVGYGMQIALLAAYPPREAVIAYTDPNTPASLNNIQRGAQILTIDGVDVANGSDTDTLNEGLAPQMSGESHTFRIQDLSGTVRTVTLTAQQTTSQPVRTFNTISTPTGNVGYILFNAHIATAEGELYNAITSLSTQNIQDLVLDLRYNGGGYLDIASELAYMIAGPAATSGQDFERLSFNSHDPLANDPSSVTDFHTKSQGFDPGLANGTTLPYLNLHRVYVLVGPGTCSASEAVVNGLRGVGVSTVLVGDTTCGKPYGFYPTDNCGLTYFAIEFAGVNEKGVQVNPDGEAPNCAVDDDFTHALGDSSEGRLAAALNYRNTGACPTGAKSLSTSEMTLIRPAPMESAWRHVVR